MDQMRDLQHLARLIRLQMSNLVQARAEPRVSEQRTAADQLLRAIFSDIRSTCSHERHELLIRSALGHAYEGRRACADTAGDRFDLVLKGEIILPDIRKVAHLPVASFSTLIFDMIIA